MRHIWEAVGGGWGPAANSVWNLLAKNKSTLTGETVSTTVSHLLQSLGLILHRENARAIMWRTQYSDNTSDFSELLGAYVACGSNEDS